MILKKRQKS